MTEKRPVEAFGDGLSKAIRAHAEACRVGIRYSDVLVAHDAKSDRFILTFEAFELPIPLLEDEEEPGE